MPPSKLSEQEQESNEWPESEWAATYTFMFCGTEFIGLKASFFVFWNRDAGVREYKAMGPEVLMDFPVPLDSAAHKKVGWEKMGDSVIQNMGSEILDLHGICLHFSYHGVQHFR